MFFKSTAVGLLGMLRFNVFNLLSLSVLTQPLIAASKPSFVFVGSFFVKNGSLLKLRPTLSLTLPPKLRPSSAARLRLPPRELSGGVTIPAVNEGLALGKECMASVNSFCFVLMSASVKYPLC